MSISTEALLDSLAERWVHKDSPTFKPAVDDRRKLTWKVTCRHYIDADRAGFAGYVVDDVLRGLNRVEAQTVADHLTRRAAA